MSKNKSTNLEQLADKIGLVYRYIERLNGQVVDEERIFLEGGSVLWETEEQAKFERDNPHVVNKMRQIEQDIHRILKE